MASRRAVRAGLLFLATAFIGFLVWYFVIRDTREEGDACEMEDSDDEDPHGLTYELDEDLDCKVESCETGYSIKDGEDFCSEITFQGGGGGGGPATEPCTQAQNDAITDPKAIVTGLTGGTCKIKSCVPDWSPSSDGQSCVFNNVGGECDIYPTIPYGTFDASGTCIEGTCPIGADNAIYTGADCDTFVRCVGGHVENASGVCVFNINAKIAHTTELLRAANLKLDEIEASIRAEEDVIMANLRANSFDTIDFESLEELHTTTTVQINELSGVVVIEGQGEMNDQWDLVNSRRNWSHFQAIYNSKQSGLTNFSSSNRCSADTTIPRSIYESAPRNVKITPGAGQTCQQVFDSKTGIDFRLSAPPRGYNVLADGECELIYGKRFTLESLTGFEFGDGIDGVSCHIPTKLVNRFKTNCATFFSMGTAQNDKGKITTTADNSPIHVRFMVKLNDTCFSDVYLNDNSLYYTFLCRYGSIEKYEFLLHETSRITSHNNVYDINMCKAQETVGHLVYQVPLFDSNFREILTLVGGTLEIVIRLVEKFDNIEYHYDHEETIDLINMSDNNFLTIKKYAPIYGQTGYSGKFIKFYDAENVPSSDNSIAHVDQTIDYNLEQSTPIIAFGLANLLLNFINPIRTKLIYDSDTKTTLFFCSTYILKLVGESFDIIDNYPAEFNYNTFQVGVYDREDNVLHIFKTNGDVHVYSGMSFDSHLRKESITVNWRFSDREFARKISAIYFDIAGEKGYYFFLRDNMLWYKKYGSSNTPVSKGKVYDEFAGLHRLKTSGHITNVAGSWSHDDSLFSIYTNNYDISGVGFGKNSAGSDVDSSNGNGWMTGQGLEPNYSVTFLLPFKP